MLKIIGKFSLLVVIAGIVSSKVWAQATIGSLDQNADQSQGMYMPMNMNYAGFNSLGMTQAAWLDPLQNLGEGQTKPAYSKYYWSPDLILPIRVREGMVTLLNFPNWELVEDIYLGDSSSFDGQISGPNTVLLYPKKGANVGVDTNIVIFGRSGNKYVFYLKSEGVNTERLTNSIIDIDVIDGPSGSRGAGVSGGSIGGQSGINASTYRGGPDKSVDSLFTKRFQREDWIKSIPLDVSKFRFDVEVYIPNPEDVVIAPERVWRDDIFTYIDLGEKSLTMTQRPIVTLIVERIEVPVGFRTKGPNNRLIIVEGIGDMVMRNGKRMVCLKLRRSDEAGLEFTPTIKDMQEHQWQVPAPIPEGKNSSDSDEDSSWFSRLGFGKSSQNSNSGSNGDDFIVSNYTKNPNGGVTISYGPNTGGGMNISGGMNVAGGMPSGNFDYAKMQHISNNGNYAPEGSFGNMGKSGSGLIFADNSNISIELGTDGDVSKLEDLWGSLSKKYPDVLKKYDPFFSVDAAADGQGKELFHLRVGPVDSLETGDDVCSRLGRNGVFCSVVRTQ